MRNTEAFSDELTRRLAVIARARQDGILIWWTDESPPRISLMLDHDRTVAYDGKSFEEAVNLMYEVEAE